MNIQAFHTFRDAAYAALRERRLLDAIAKLEELAIFSQQGSVYESLQALRQDYAGLLEFMKSGRDDTDRQTHFDAFIRKAYNLADILCRRTTLRYIDCQERLIAQRLKGSAETLADVYIPLVEGKDGQPASIAQIMADPLASYQQLFDTIWVSGQWSETLRHECASYVMDDVNPRINRLAMVSAAGLALFLAFDEEKCLFLLDVIEEHQVEISVRALTFFLLLYAIYAERLALYPAIQLKLKFLSELTYFHPLVLEVQKQLLLAPHNPDLADLIDKSLPERIVSAHEQMKELPDNLTQDDLVSYLKKHPKARRLHHDMLSMMHEFVEMQEKGVDLSYQTFKNVSPIVPFFREAANWFSPFSLDHPLLLGVNPAARFFSVVVNNKACDTERFAVFFTIAPHLPEIRVVQQNMLTMEEKKMEGDDAENFIEKLADHMEHEEAEGQRSLLTIKPKRLRRYVVSCVQDCFRFFTLYGAIPEAKSSHDEENEARTSIYPVKEACSIRLNPFDYDMCLWKDDNFRAIFSSVENKSDVAKWIFELADYEDALSLYDELPPTADNLSRKAFAFQELELFSLAQETYRQSLVLDPDNEHTTMNLVNSYRVSDKYEEAAVLLENLVSAHPEDLDYSRLLAEMYMCAEHFDKAKLVYIKNDYLHPDHASTIRGLAWCCLALGETDKAAEYYLRLLASSKVQPNDYLNAGHCALISHDVPSALLYYQEYIKSLSLDRAPATLFEEDKHFLVERGVDPTTQQLVIDLLNL